MLKHFIAAFLILCMLALVSFRPHNTTVAGEKNPALIPDSTSRPFAFRSVIDSLEIADILTIKWRTSGCFHGYGDSIIVQRVKSGFFVRHGIKSKVLSADEADALRDFDYGVSRIALDFGGCTTTEYYTYKWKQTIYLAARDGTCRWHGFNALLAALRL
jgi:hypothetical protein